MKQRLVKLERFRCKSLKKNKSKTSNLTYKTLYKESKENGKGKGGKRSRKFVIKRKKSLQMSSNRVGKSTQNIRRSVKGGSISKKSQNKKGSMSNLNSVPPKFYDSPFYHTRFLWAKKSGPLPKPETIKRFEPYQKEFNFTFDCFSQNYHPVRIGPRMTRPDRYPKQIKGSKSTQNIRVK